MRTFFDENVVMPNGNVMQGLLANEMGIAFDGGIQVAFSVVIEDKDSVTEEVLLDAL